MRLSPFHSRRRELGTDDFPFRQAIGVVLLVGLVMMMPNVFVGFFHGIVNKAFQGIRNDPDYCVLGCKIVSPQEKRAALLVKSARNYPLAAACDPAAPAKPGSARPAPKLCTQARTACARQDSLSPVGKVCDDKGWKTAPKVGTDKTKLLLLVSAS
jgi:hypothetical protein